MNETEELRAVIEDLIEATHLQAKELERLVTHVEQQTVPLEPASQISIVASELSELHNRVKKLRSK